MVRNHEGYHDPTAGKAIRMAARRHKKGITKSTAVLTYKLREVPGFPHRV